MSYIDFLKKFPQSILNREQSSNSGKLWDIFVPQYDELEATLNTFKDLLYIYQQSGVTLDDIGALVNESRRGADSDDTYRVFLAIAISKRISRGTIPDMIEIGKFIPGEGGLGFSVDELWDKAGSSYLDGNSLLDGTEPLDPDESRPASVLVELDGLIENLPTPILIASAVDEIRAAGVYAKTAISLRIITDLLTLYVTLPGPTLDGEGFLDGGTLMNEKQNLAVHEIAIGDGATGEPNPGDIGLDNEVFRRTAVVRTVNDAGDREYSIEIKSSQVNGVGIDELALFNIEGDMIAKVTFSPREKNSSIVYFFKVQETYN